MKPDEPNNARNNPSPKPAELRTNYHKIERREWWLWLTAGVITLLLTAALVSFFLPGGPAHENHSLADMPQAMRGQFFRLFIYSEEAVRDKPGGLGRIEKRAVCVKGAGMSPVVLH